MTHEEKAPPEASVEADAATDAEFYFLFERQPTWRDRRFWRDHRFRGLTASDWAQVAILFVIGLGGPWWMLQQAQHMRPDRQPIAQWLAVAFGTLAGGMLAYTLLRRLIFDLITTSRHLSHNNREAIDTARNLISAVSDWVERAYTAGQQDALAAAATTAETRIAELEHELAQPPLLTAARYTATIEARLDALQQDIAEIQNLRSDQAGQVDDLTTDLAELNARADALAAEIARQNQHRPAIDAMDDWILAQLGKTPQPTDEAIGKIVNLSTSQVLRRRNRLAAAGYPAAQKRQGQRPGTR